MKYNKYKAPEGKVLFNLENFTYGHTILSVHDLNLIILDEGEAKALSEGYMEIQDKVKENERSIREDEDSKEESFAEEAEPAIALMSLNDEGEYEEVTEVNPVEAFKKEKIAELLSKGVPFNVDIQRIVHNTKHI